MRLQVQVAMLRAQGRKKVSLGSGPAWRPHARALAEVPEEAPADAMLDFYNELSAAVRGRLEGANTISRVNDAFRDVFEAFILSSYSPEYSPEATEICVVPVACTDSSLSEQLRVVCSGDEHTDWIDSRQGELGRIVDPASKINPPLRKIHAPERNWSTPEYRRMKPKRPAFAASHP